MFASDPDFEMPTLNIASTSDHDNFADSIAQSLVPMLSRAKKDSNEWKYNGNIMETIDNTLSLENSSYSIGSSRSYATLVKVEQFFNFGHLTPLWPLCVLFNSYMSSNSIANEIYVHYQICIRHDDIAMVSNE